MANYERAAWGRLGQAVHEARTEAGLGLTADWVEEVNRSSRVLLGLERGERVGTSTLHLIEDALGWPRGGCFRILTGGVEWRDLAVTSQSQEVREADALGELAAVIADLRRELDETRARVLRLEGRAKPNG